MTDTLKLVLLQLVEVWFMEKKSNVDEIVVFRLIDNESQYNEVSE